MSCSCLSVGLYPSDVITVRSSFRSISPLPSWNRSESIIISHTRQRISSLISRLALHGASNNRSFATLQRKKMKLQSNHTYIYVVHSWKIETRRLFQGLWKKIMPKGEKKKLNAPEISQNPSGRRCPYMTYILPTYWKKTVKALPTGTERRHSFDPYNTCRDRELPRFREQLQRFTASVRFPFFCYEPAPLRQPKGQVLLKDLCLQAGQNILILQTQFRAKKKRILIIQKPMKTSWKS